jgi:hypothetical protein
MAFLVIVFSCSDDPKSFCKGGLCDDNPAIEQQCIDAYNKCKSIDNGTDEECKAIALGVCNL